MRGSIVREQTEYYESAAGQGIVTPKLNLDELVWPRSKGFPAAHLDLGEVLDFLVETGSALAADRNGYVRQAIDSLALVNPLGRSSLEWHMQAMTALFDRDILKFEFDQALGHVGDGWQRVQGPGGASFEQRWFPSRMIHIMAGNAPGASALGIIRTALIRGIALMKLPSNDPFTAIAILRTMADLDANHPLVQSMSAVYWRGGDISTESVLMRPQFFDKIVAWGGEGAIRSVTQYIGPGLELVAFDPKSSASIIDLHAITSNEELNRVANLAAIDVGYQEGCVTSRSQYVAGAPKQVDEYCEALLDALHDYHAQKQGALVRTPAEITEEVDAVRGLGLDYGVWGGYDGSGLVVRSAEPVDFYPDARTVNVVQVNRLTDALRFVNVATQTIGVYPPQAKTPLRDGLAAAGADRVCNLGTASALRSLALGVPHDGMIPLHRLCRWILCQV